MTAKKPTGKPPIHPKKAAPKSKKPRPLPAPPKETASPEQYGRAMDDIIQFGDLKSLTAPQRSEFLYKLSMSMGLNPMSQPFELITLNGKLTIYAKRTAADQLRQKHKITSEVISEGPLKIGDVTRDDVYCVKVKLTNPDGRVEYAIGCVGIAGLSDEALANCIMKCHTKAMRRGTLSFCGLGFLDEIEVDSVQQAAKTGVGSPKRAIPRITSGPQPASGPTVVAPAVVVAPPQTNPAPANPVNQTAQPTVFPPVKPPVQVKLPGKDK